MFHCFISSTIQKRLFSSNIYIESSLAILLNHGFTESQSKHIINSLDKFIKRDTHEIINRSLNCWKKKVIPKNIDYVTRIQQEFNNVFADKEARLLLMDEEFISNRIKNINNLDLVRGINDIWNVFHKAPVGFFLQDWKEFSKKYYYITFKIFPLINKETKDTRNPIVEYPTVMEQSYKSIKTRFIFAQRTGLQVSKNNNVNMNTLLLVPIEEFIKIYAPYCSIEEFKGLEKLNSLDLGKEDDALFEDLIELLPKEHPKNNNIEKKINEGILLNL